MSAAEIQNEQSTYVVERGCSFEALVLTLHKRFTPNENGNEKDKKWLGQTLNAQAQHV